MKTHTLVLTAEETQRFWSKVHRQGPQGCWLWMGKPAGDGYGRIQITRNGVGRSHRAHRIAYLLTHGHLDRNKLVCHTCDDPMCVNPGHLFLGTEKDNMRDKMRKGRHRAGVGVKNGNARLCPRSVRWIRRMVAAGHLRAEVGQTLGVSRQCIDDIVNRRNWGHVA